MVAFGLTALLFYFPEVWGAETSQLIQVQQAFVAELNQFLDLVHSGLKKQIQEKLFQVTEESFQWEWPPGVIGCKLGKGDQTWTWSTQNSFQEWLRTAEEGAANICQEGESLWQFRAVGWFDHIPVWAACTQMDEFFFTYYFDGRRLQSVSPSIPQLGKVWIIDSKFKILFPNDLEYFGFKLDISPLELNSTTKKKVGDQELEVTHLSIPQTNLAIVTARLILTKPLFQARWIFILGLVLGMIALMGLGLRLFNSQKKTKPYQDLEGSFARQGEKIMDVSPKDSSISPIPEAEKKTSSNVPDLKTSMTLTPSLGVEQQLINDFFSHFEKLPKEWIKSERFLSRFSKILRLPTHDLQILNLKEPIELLISSQALLQLLKLGFKNISQVIFEIEGEGPHPALLVKVEGQPRETLVKFWPEKFDWALSLGAIDGKSSNGVMIKVPIEIRPASEEFIAEQTEVTQKIIKSLQLDPFAIEDTGKDHLEKILSHWNLNQVQLRPRKPILRFPLEKVRRVRSRDHET